VQVVELTRGRAYTTARVEPAPDDGEAGDEAAAAIELYERVAAAAGGEPDPAIAEDAAPVSYAIAARVDFPGAEKQRILEQRSERGRLMVIVELLARALENIAASAEIRERAHTNGKVAPPGGKG
jgi:hypothetical protein